MAVRQSIKIDEELCNGCGACVLPCAEGAIVLENGKARVKDETLCDGAGFCIPLCPTGAMSIEEKAEALMEEHGGRSSVRKTASLRC